MNKTQLYKMIAGGMLLLNVLVLLFFLTNQPTPRPDHDRPPTDFQEDLARMLELDSAQRITFFELANEHKRQVTHINEQQQALLLTYFDGISRPATELDTASVLDEYQQWERKKLILTRAHFTEIKSILKPEQLPLYQIFMNRVTDRIIRRREKRRPPTKDFE